MLNQILPVWQAVRVCRQWESNKTKINLVSGVFEGKMFTYFFPALRYAAIGDSTGMEISYKGEKDCDITILQERFFPSGKKGSIDS